MDNKNWAEYERDRFWYEHFAKALHKKILSDEEYIELLCRVDKTLRMKHKIKNKYRRKV